MEVYARTLPRAAKGQVNKKRKLEQSCDTAGAQVRASTRLVPKRRRWDACRMDTPPSSKPESRPESRPEITAALARGVTRVMFDHGLSPMLEIPLANGRRADVMAIGPHGEIWIVETKSGLADFAVDEKWPDYLEYCDRYFFGVTEDFPQDLIPEHCGLIVADAFGGAILRMSPLSPLAPARRKAVTLQFARLAAQRLSFIASVSPTVPPVG